MTPRRGVPPPLPDPVRSGAEIDPLGHSLAVAHRGWTVLCCEADGWIEPAGDGTSGSGLFDVDTRVLSRRELRVGGERPSGTGTVAASGERWSAHLQISRGGGDPAGPRLPEDVVDVEVTRVVGHGMRERIVVVNHSMAPLVTSLELRLGADFVDVLELTGRRRHDGTTTAGWDPTACTLEIRHAAAFEGRRVERALRVVVEGTDPAPAWAGDGSGDGHRLTFDMALEPGERWAVELAFASLVDGTWRTPAALESGPHAASRARRRDGRLADLPGLAVRSPGGLVDAAVAQSAADLAALRNDVLEAELDPSAGRAWVTNAGVPRFTGFFGRDSLTAAYQAAMLGPELMRGAVGYAARHPGRRDDPWNEEQPGRMVHEMRRGPVAALGIRPHAAYYGTHTTGAMFLVALSELWHWTGDRAVLESHVDAARDAIDWAERFGDLDGDGFLEYVRRSPDGLKNQGWKDSDEAIRDEQGRLVENPIATVEEQAFHYVALERMAEIHVVLGDDAAADACLGRAAQLRRRFAGAFWLADEGFLALALGPDKRPLATIASNAGHALAAGILDPAAARRVAERLLAPDLLTAWGVRSLSADHPSFNPFGYHLGAIWPVENASFALGCKRYGLDGDAEVITDAIFRAAGHHARLRLPELMAGLGLESSRTPVAYPRANRPQAWSASAIVQALQVMLGLYPFAGAGILALVRPRLPSWLPQLSLAGLRVGSAVVDLEFERRPDGSTAWELRRADGPISVVDAPPPADVAAADAPAGERITRWAVEHLPGRTGRAIRIALGIETPRAAS